MKIAFVRPLAPFNRYIQNVPLNYIHLAAFLREKGHHPVILDQVLESVSKQHVDETIRQEKIQVVGIGCMTCEFSAAVEEAKRLKQVHPDIIVIFGGAHPSADPEECLQTGCVDFVIVGEGEIALDNLLSSLEAGSMGSGIQGVWEAKDGKAVPSTPAPVPDINALPRPAYDLLPLDQYFKLDSPWHFPKSQKAVQFISSRGCPYRCSYCHTIHGKKYRGQDADTVLDHMEWLVRQHGVREFMMVDDIFNFDPERAKAICRGIRDRGLNIHLQFPNGVRGDRFDEELVQLMKAAGTHFMAVAIETVSKKFQKLIRKNLQIDKALQTIKWARKHKIEVSGFFMIGFPGETIEDVKKTIDFAVKAPLDAIFVSIVTPFKGTVLRNDMVEGRFGAMESDTIDALNEMFPVVKSETLTRDVLKKLQMQAYWRFYLRPRSMSALLKRMTNGKNLKKIVRAVGRRLVSREVVSAN